MATERLPVIRDEAKEVYVGTRTNISSLYTGFYITAPCCCRKKATVLSSILRGFRPIVSVGLCQHGPGRLCLEFANPLWTGEVPGVNIHGLEKEPRVNAFIRAGYLHKGRAVKLYIRHSNCFK